VGVGVGVGGWGGGWVVVVVVCVWGGGAKGRRVSEVMEVMDEHGGVCVCIIQTIPAVTTP
jgi:hypothetical protein